MAFSTSDCRIRNFAGKKIIGTSEAKRRESSDSDAKRYGSPNKMKPLPAPIKITNAENVDRQTEFEVM